MTDYYSTLGVNKNATPDEIKKAYRKLANQHHPDRGGNTKKFQEIQAAYDVLSDDQKRAEYDNPNPFGGMGSGPGGFHFEAGGMPPGFEHIFGAGFGGGGFGGNPFEQMFGHRQQPRRNKTLNLQTSIALEDAFAGKELTLSVRLPSGREQVIEVKIPKGIAPGTTLRLAGMGDDSIPGIQRGDIHLTVNINPHPIFERQGDDLVRTIEVDAIDAMLGTTIKTQTIDGRSIDVKIYPGTQPGQVLAAHGYGMPNMNDSRFVGRMLINIKVTIPSNLTETQKTQLKEIFSK